MDSHFYSSTFLVLKGHFFVTASYGLVICVCDSVRFNFEDMSVLLYLCLIPYSLEQYMLMLTFQL
jgi:hypothetical protein